MVRSAWGRYWGDGGRAILMPAVVCLSVGGAVLCAVISLVSGPGPATAGSVGQQAAAAATGPADRSPPIQVPDGFVVEKVAGPPLVEHPVMAGFDHWGRLFVADNAGLNLKAADLEKQLPNSIRLLEDSDGDGRFDRSTVFADKLTFPMGALWYDGAVYAACPPYIWRFEDRDGDGVAERREELVGKFGYSGNAASIHGCFLGPEGRLYWTDGRHGHELPAEPGRPARSGLAARIFSCRLDGSDVEILCGGGMDDPVELVFTPEGEVLGTVDIFRAKPRRDALVHWVYGGVYPRTDQKCLSEFKRTGELLGEVSQFGQVAPAGALLYRSGHLGPQYRGNVFIAQFNRHAVVRVVLERDGATFRSRAEPFLTSPSIDFHPTDVLEDADGSLLVVDTGGWFRIGCPLSQVAKPQIKGGIYRIRPAGRRPVSDPRGRKLRLASRSAGELVGWLADPRPAVQDEVMWRLAKLGPASVPALARVLQGSKSAEARRNAVWTLARIGSSAALQRLRPALHDADPTVRCAAAKVCGLAHHADSVPDLIQLLSDQAPFVRRMAAGALARLRAGSAVPALLAALRERNDEFLQHALIHALIEIADRQATVAGLHDPSPQVRRGALIALDQMDGGNLTRDLVTPLLDTDDPPLQRAVLGVISKRPQWSGQIVGLLRGWLQEPELPAERRTAMRGALVAFSNDRQIQELVAEALARPNTSQPLRLLLLEVISRCSLPTLPNSWGQQLRRALNHPDPAVRRQALAAIEATGPAAFVTDLDRIAHDASQPVELRVAATQVLVRRRPKLDTDLFALLSSQLGQDSPPLIRLAAAETVGQATWDREQLMALTKLVSQAGALELPPLLAAFERGGDPTLGRALLQALDRSPGLLALHQKQLQDAVQNFPPSVRETAKPLLKRLAADVEQQRARLAELQKRLQPGDPQRGRQLFLSNKLGCSACHRVGSDGGNVGPELTDIGSIRARRDLLEAIVFPSASFVRGYQPYLIATTDGRVISGLLSRETATAIYLRTADRAEVFLPRKSVEAMRLSNVSIMPQGLDAQLTTQELSDLLAFLQSLKSDGRALTRAQAQ